VTLPHDITDLSNRLLDGLRAALGDNLVALYLRGSLALGDFVPETSDVDYLAVTERPTSEAEFAALAAVHEQIATLPNTYARRFEIAYIDRAALRRFTPGISHLTLGQGETLGWAEHRDNWILERWIARAHAIPLFGPAADTLIDPIESDELRAAVGHRLLDWADWTDQVDDPDWRLPLSHKAYVVETMCRALYTLDRGELCSKPQAVAWALETLPEPWRTTVDRSRAWRTDSTVDQSVLPEVQRFVYWAAGDRSAASE
jgi:hypothetical protein